MAARRFKDRILLECSVEDTSELCERARAILELIQSHTTDYDICEETRWHSLEMVKDLIPEKHPDLEYLEREFPAKK